MDCTFSSYLRRIYLSESAFLFPTQTHTPHSPHSPSPSSLMLVPPRIDLTLTLTRSHRSIYVSVLLLTSVLHETICTSCSWCLKQAHTKYRWEISCGVFEYACIFLIYVLLCVSIIGYCEANMIVVLLLLVPSFLPPRPIPVTGLYCYSVTVLDCDCTGLWYSQRLTLLLTTALTLLIFAIREWEREICHFDGSWWKGMNGDSDFIGDLNN